METERGMIEISGKSRDVERRKLLCDYEICESGVFRSLTSLPDCFTQLSVYIRIINGSAMLALTKSFGNQSLYIVNVRVPQSFHDCSLAMVDWLISGS